MTFHISMPISSNQYFKGRSFLTINSISEADAIDFNGVLREKFYGEADLRKGRKLDGVYSEKHTRLDDSVPWFIRKLIGEDVCKLREQCWDSAPYVKYILSSPRISKKKCMVTIEILAKDDLAVKSNTLSLSSNHLKHRKIAEIDLSDGSPKSRLYVAIYGRCRIPGIANYFSHTITTRAPEFLRNLTVDIIASIGQCSDLTLKELKEIEEAVWRGKFGTVTEEGFDDTEEFMDSE
ncbi:hypothetical protein L596_007329 [Steinernema carpocapsae]|uniref:Phosphatidylinositol transfer protein N-terminal domain-containing protein n=1 Tax=Steinernema carpocapsae TaxID=34508 RepID=A0A4U5P923_STECR|nr:hypothetical protein L596_007329 [Steinernema carpocapsae]